MVCRKIAAAGFSRSDGGCGHTTPLSQSIYKFDGLDGVVRRSVAASANQQCFSIVGRR
jgi:hypothetical protein